MDYFTKFLRTGGQPAKPPTDHAQEFSRSWNHIHNTLLYPDERQLSKGINSTDVPSHLQSMVDALVRESARTEEGTTGVCMEYLLKNDVLGTLVRLSETDRPFGIQAEVLRAIQNMVILLDEQFLVHSAVHKAVLRLLRTCVGDDLQEQLDGRNKKVMGAAGASVRGQPSEYEEDLVNLLCILCSRIRTYRELLMIFFHDKHWYRSEPLFSVEEEEDVEDEDEDEEEEENQPNPERPPSQATIRSAPLEPPTKKPEYEFLLFNYLLRFVHREGQIGDFARAGLLFLIDVAMSPVDSLNGVPPSTAAHPDPITDAALALAEYILDGDFSEVLGAGLGAVYSLLPTKIEFVPPSDGGMAIGSVTFESEDDKEMFDVVRAKARAMGVEDANNPDFRSRLDHFLKLMEFLQDVLRKNKSQDLIDASSLVGSAIVGSIQDAVRRIFLENILYPSVLECSDVDGSAVAVMSYIEIMVDTLRDGQLAELLLDFLMSEDNDETRTRPRTYSLVTLNPAASQPPVSTANDKQAKARRRKSSAMVLLEMEAPDAKKPSEYFTAMGRFTLKDLILTNLRSSSQPAGTAALQLVQSMLLQHPQLCIERLLLVIPDPQATSYPNPSLDPISIAQTSSPEDEELDDDVFVYPSLAPETKPSLAFRPLFTQPETTHSSHERELDIYLALISRIDPSHNGDPFSTGYENYLYDSLSSIQGQLAYRIHPDVNVEMEGRAKAKHRLNMSDPIISLLMEALRKFFSNAPQYNIALTGVLSTIAIHPDRSLSGWLTFGINDSAFEKRHDDPRDTSVGSEDGDDRSVDFDIEQRLAEDGFALPASSLNDNTRPILYTIFQGLVSQLERYRRGVDDFDRYLIERRRGLLFSENLTDALSLGWELPEETASPSPAFEPSQSFSKPLLEASNSFVSFLSPKKNKPRAPVPPSVPSTPSKSKDHKGLSANPFAPHYQQTGSITVEPFILPPPSTGSWSKGPSQKWDVDDGDFFSSGWSENEQRRRPAAETEKAKPADITLSQLLDNVVILEESMKELAAIIHARRCLGIDAVKYL